MNKYIILLLSLFVLLFISCSDSDDKVDAFSVLSVDNSFADIGGEGIIRVSQEDVEVDVDVDWLSASVTGKEIQLIVDKNTAIDARTANLRLRKMDQIQKLAIVQLGNSFWIKGFSNDETLIFRDYILEMQSESHGTFEIIETPNWLTLEINDFSMQLKVSSVPTATTRGEVIISDGGGRKRTFPVIFVPNSVFYGQWELTYDNGYASNNIHTIPVTINTDGSMDGLSIYANGDIPITIPSTLSIAAATMSIPFGVLLAKDQANFVYLCSRTPTDNNGNWSYWRPGVGHIAYLGNISMDIDANKLNITFPKIEDGNVAGMTFYKFGVENPIDYSKANGAARSLLNLKLTKSL